ncbi:MAG: hypothetical protein WCO56_21830 [Verrucomicrobiota bacterium]
MKNILSELKERKQQAIVAMFGNAKLLALGDGTVELCGGSATEQSEAKEWLSLFMHEAVLRTAGRRPARGV